MPKTLIGLCILFSIIAGMTIHADVVIFDNKDLYGCIKKHLPERRAISEKNRAIILGFDGISYRIIDPLLAEGELPNFRRLFESGSRFLLNSTNFPSSAVAWPSLSTGCLPTETGLNSFFMLNHKTYKFNLVNSSLRRKKAIWEIANHYNRRSVVVNVPMTYPPDNIDGIMITGLLTPRDSIFTHPSSMSPDLRKIGYSTSYMQFKRRVGHGESAFALSAKSYDVNEILDITMNRINLGNFLSKEVDWDFYMIVFTITDRLQHNQSQIGDDIINHIYKQIDKILGIYMNMVDENTSLAVVSDHGFRNYNEVFHLVPWLVEEDLMVFKNGQPDWSKSQFIPLDRVGNYSMLRFNVRNRESRGCVNPGDAHGDSEIFKKLESAFSKLVDTNNEKVSRSIEYLENSNMRYANGPEILLKVREGCLINNDMIENVNPWYHLKTPVYDHEFAGVGILYNPSKILKNESLETDIVNITPTMLYLMDLPIPRDMSGTLIREAIKPEILKANPPKYSSLDISRNFSGNVMFENPEVMDQLKLLGYIPDQ